ncbi:MAG TPA: hypothetical protein VFC22_07260 [Solirubrobacteraceae bacterium]|jgi:hypothetical protein|nr:hypothetical protein [Solirubrobacteraceae bacterium]
MPDHEYIVLSKPPEGVSAEEFNDWYDRHMGEILELPGFVSAQRSALTLRGHRGKAFDYEYIVRYGIDGDLDATLAGLREAVEAGRLYFPDWFPSIRTSGFAVAPITETVKAVAA